MINYDPHEWQSHLFDVKGSMLREIMPRVAACMAFAVLITVAYEAGLKQLGVNLLVHQIVGLALGMLLVFRTNSSYDRFWEGRRMWGNIINETRNLARSAVAFLATDPARVERVIDWTIAFPYAAMNALRGQRGIGPVAARLPGDEVNATLEANHVPLAVAGRITGELRAARDAGTISDFVMTNIDQNVQLLVDYIGSCERIRSTPLPFAYMVHLRRALILYCYTLPFALVNDFGWLTIVVTGMVAFIFLGVEEIGVEIEDPFGVDENDLPLDAFCSLIERNLQPLIPTSPAGPNLSPPESGPRAMAG